MASPHPLTQVVQGNLQEKTSLKCCLFSVLQVDSHPLLGKPAGGEGWFQWNPLGSSCVKIFPKKTLSLVDIL